MRDRGTLGFSGWKTHITAILLLLLQALHAAGYVTDKGAQASSWTLAALMGIFLRMALSEATVATQAKLDAINAGGATKVPISVGQGIR